MNPEIQKIIAQALMANGGQALTPDQQAIVARLVPQEPATPYSIADPATAAQTGTDLTDFIRGGSFSPVSGPASMERPVSRFTGAGGPSEPAIPPNAGMMPSPGMLPQGPAMPPRMANPDPMAQPDYRAPSRGAPEPLDPDLMQDALRGQYDETRRFDDSRAVQTAEVGGLTGDRAEEEGPPPTMDQLVEMGKAAGIDINALRGLNLNATEARSFGYLLRMMEAENTIRNLSESNTLGQRLLELLPGQDIEAMLMDPDYRRYMLARDNFNEAALRSATGATINNSELPTQRRNYFPLPVDDEETRDLLRRQREALMMSLVAASGPGGAVVPAFGQPVVPRQQMSDEDFLKSLGLE